MTVSKTFRLDAEVVKKLEKVAEEEKRTLANLVKKILSDFAENK